MPCMPVVVNAGSCTKTMLDHLPGIIVFAIYYIFDACWRKRVKTLSYTAAFCYSHYQSAHGLILCWKM